MLRVCAGQLKRKDVLFLFAVGHELVDGFVKSSGGMRRWLLYAALPKTLADQKSGTGRAAVIMHIFPENLSFSTLPCFILRMNAEFSVLFSVHARPK
jgi:hypothetical protein